MLGRIFYIRMSIFLTAFSFMLSACSKSGGTATTPNQQNPLNKTLNQTTPASQGAFASGGKFKIINPAAGNIVPKENLHKDPPPSDSKSNSAGVDKVVGTAPVAQVAPIAQPSTSVKSGGLAAPAPLVAAYPAQTKTSAPTEQATTPMNRTAAVTTRWMAPRPSFEKMPSVATARAAIQPPRLPNPSLSKMPVNMVQPLVPSFSVMPPATPGTRVVSTTRSHATQVKDSIKVTMHDQNNKKEVLRRIPAKTAIRGHVPAVKTRTVAKRSIGKKTAKRRVVVMRDDGGTVDPALVQRLDSLPVAVYSVLGLRRDQIGDLYGTTLDIGELNVNTSHGAAITTNADYGTKLSEYGEYVPLGVYYLFSASPKNHYVGNNVCDVTVKIGSYDYHNAPCVVFQKDSINGTVRETAYNLYVQRRPDNSVRRIVRLNDSNLREDMPYIRRFLAGMHDGIYIVSFEKNLPGQE